MELLTVEQLAGKLKVHKSWVYRQTRQRGPDSIPRVPVGKYLRFNLMEVLSWLRDQGAQRS